MTLRAFIAVLALTASFAPVALAQDDAIRGDSQKVVIDASRVESATASANAHCLRWRAHAELIETRGSYVTYRCVRIAP